MDVQALKTNLDLLTLVGQDTTLRKVAGTCGGEYAGPCPFCGGQDRFRVQPERGRWWCRHCGGEHWQDAIAYVQKRDNLDFRGAVRVLGGDDGDHQRATRRPAVPADRPTGPPPAAWQVRARMHVKRCADMLWTAAGKPGLAHLRERGLRDDTIRRFRLGYNARDVYDRPALWGLDGNKIHLGRGITIPHLVGDVLWGIKVRLLPPQVWQGREVKYSSPRGSVAALFGAGELRGDGRALLLCEGEFDAMLAWQECNDLVDVATLAGAKGHIPARWLLYLLPYRQIIAGYDTDDAGESGAARLAALSQRIERATVPRGKDVCDFHAAGGDLRAWVESLLLPPDDLPPFRCPICDGTRFYRGAPPTWAWTCARCVPPVVEHPALAEET